MNFLQSFKSYLDSVENNTVKQHVLDECKQQFQEAILKNPNLIYQLFDLIDENISEPGNNEKSRWLAFAIEVNPDKFLNLTDEQKIDLSNYYVSQGLSRNYLNGLIALHSKIETFIFSTDAMDDSYFIEFLHTLPKENQIVELQRRLNQNPKFIDNILNIFPDLTSEILAGMTPENLVLIFKDKPELLKFLDPDLFRDAFVNLILNIDGDILLDRFQNFNRFQKQYCFEVALADRPEILAYIPIVELKNLLAESSSSTLIEYLKFARDLLNYIPLKNCQDKSFLMELKQILSDEEMQCFMEKDNFYLSVLHLFSWQELETLMKISEKQLQNAFVTNLISFKDLKEDLRANTTIVSAAIKADLNNLKHVPKEALEEVFASNRISFKDLNEDLRSNTSIVSAAIKADLNNLEYVPKEKISQSDFLQAIGVREVWWKFIIDLLASCFGSFITLDWMYERISPPDSSSAIQLKI